MQFRAGEMSNILSYYVLCFFNATTAALLTFATATQAVHWQIRRLSTIHQRFRIRLELGITFVFLQFDIIFVTIYFVAVGQPSRLLSFSEDVAVFSHFLQQNLT